MRQGKGVTRAKFELSRVLRVLQWNSRHLPLPASPSRASRMRIVLTVYIFLKPITSAFITLGMAIEIASVRLASISGRKPKWRARLHACALTVSSTFGPGGPCAVDRSMSWIGALLPMR